MKPLQRLYARLLRKEKRSSSLVAVLSFLRFAQVAFENEVIAATRESREINFVSPIQITTIFDNLRWQVSITADQNDYRFMHITAYCTDATLLKALQPMLVEYLKIQIVSVDADKDNDTLMLTAYTAESTLLDTYATRMNHT